MWQFQTKASITYLSQIVILSKHFPNRKKSLCGGIYKDTFKYFVSMLFEKKRSPSSVSAIRPTTHHPQQQQCHYFSSDLHPQQGNDILLEHSLRKEEILIASFISDNTSCEIDNKSHQPLECSVCLIIALQSGFQCTRSSQRSYSGQHKL